MAACVGPGSESVRDDSERGRVEDSLRRSEARLKEAQRNAHIGSWRFVPGEPLDWSDEMYQLFKLPPGIRPDREAAVAVIHPQDRDGGYSRLFKAALDAGANEFRGEYRVVWPDGQIRHILAIGKIQRAADGAVIEAFGTAQDVTDLKQAEQQAKRAAARLAVLADASRAFAEVAHDYRAVLEEVARRAAESLADTCQVRLLSDDGQWMQLAALHSRDQQVTEGLRAMEAVAPRRVDGGRYASVVKTGAPLFLPVITLEEIKAENPPERWPFYERFTPHSVIVVPLRVHERCIGVLGMVRYRPEQPAFCQEDLSLAQEIADRAALTINNARLFEQAQRELAERKRAEAESERLAAVIEQAAEVVMVTDVAGVIQYVNPAFEAVTGYTRAEAMGKNPRMLKSGENDAELYRALWATLSAGKTWHGRLTNRKKDGSLYTEDATISPVRDATGATTGYVGLKRDITRDLSLEAQLIQAQKLEGIGRLAGGIAHDFNNMLSVILTCARFGLEALRPGDPLREELAEIERAGERAASLTRQLLAFSRRQVLKAEPLDINRVIAGMHRMLRRLLGEDVELVELLAPDAGIVKGDVGQVEQVLMNLAVNARDAMPGGGKLTISTANVELDATGAAGHPGVPPGAYLRIAVTDSGVGMDAATQARIFEPFFTTKGPGQGTGLGLSTAHGILAQSGGSIHVYSEPGRGTTFTVYLPRIDGAVSAAPAAPAQVTSGGSETVLLVEDDDAVRSVARRMLERAGYTVLAAASGREGLALCEQHQGDVQLVLSDVVMPGMSGPAFVEQAVKLRPRMKVLFMSGYTDDATVRDGVLDADTDFIAKPLTQAELLRRVREALDRAPATAR